MPDQEIFVRKMAGGCRTEKIFAGEKAVRMQDNRKMLVLNSVTYAYKARDYLQRKGIRVYVERIPEHLRVSGCGYGVRANNDAEQIAAILNDAGIPVKNIIKL